MTFQDLIDELFRLYPQGSYAEALEVIEQHANRFPEQLARTTFWRMCLLSLCGRADDTISVFRQGLDAGLWWRNDVFNDSDLNAVRDLPAFQRLMAESQEKYEANRTQVEQDQAVLVPEEPAAGAYPLLIALHGPTICCWFRPVTATWVSNARAMRCWCSSWTPVMTEETQLAGRLRRLAATVVEAVLVPSLTLVLVMIAGVVEAGGDDSGHGGR
jgi:hypothetical protein